MPEYFLSETHFSQSFFNLIFLGFETPKVRLVLTRLRSLSLSIPGTKLNQVNISDFISEISFLICSELALIVFMIRSLSCDAWIVNLLALCIA